MVTETTTARVAITCLASYNAGRLIYEWVDATDVDELEECRQRVAAAAVEAAKAAGEYPVYFGEPEEFFLSDYEGFGNAIGEYTPFARVAALGAAIEEHGEAFLAYLTIADGSDSEDADDLVASFQDAYVGEYDSEKDYAESFVSECGWGGVPAGELEFGGSMWPPVKINVLESLESYLDYDMIARELFMEHSFEDGHVFRSY